MVTLFSSSVITYTYWSCVNIHIGRSRICMERLHIILIHRQYKIHHIYIHSIKETDGETWIVVSVSLLLKQNLRTFELSAFVLQSTNVCMCIYTFTYKQFYRYTYFYIRMYIHTPNYMCSNMYIYTYICVYIYV